MNTRDFDWRYTLTSNIGCACTPAHPCKHVRCFALYQCAVCSVIRKKNFYTFPWWFLCCNSSFCFGGLAVKVLNLPSPNPPPYPPTQVVYSTDRLALCCFVFYSTRRLVLCLTVCYFVIVLFSSFSIAITSLGKERANLSAFRTFVRYVLV